MMETINQAQTEAVNISSTLDSTPTQFPPPVNNDNQKNANNSQQVNANTKRSLTQEATTTNNCISNADRIQLNEEEEDGNFIEHQNSKKVETQTDSLPMVENKIVKSPFVTEEEDEDSPERKRFKYDIGNDIEGEHVSKTCCKVLYNDEDELLRSDDDDYDDSEGIDGKNAENKSVDNISKEEEEQLLRSDDEEETQNELAEKTPAGFSSAEHKHQFSAADIIRKQEEAENLEVDSAGNNGEDHCIVRNIEREDSSSRSSSYNNNGKIVEFRSESSDKAPRLENHCGQDHTSQTIESLTQQSLLETTTDVNDLDEKEDALLVQRQSQEHHKVPNKGHNPFAMERNSPETQITFENVFADKKQTREGDKQLGKWDTNVINADDSSNTTPPRSTQLNGEHTSTGHYLPSFRESITNSKENVSADSLLSAESIGINSKQEGDEPGNPQQIEEGRLNETSSWTQSFADEAASRSSVNSCSSDSSSTSSSSQQLVIDHPMDPMDDLMKEERAFKTDLKRKLSHSSASESTEPQQKQINLADKSDNSCTFADRVRESIVVNDEHMKMGESVEKISLKITNDHVSEKELACESSLQVKETKGKAICIQIKEEEPCSRGLNNDDKAALSKTNNDSMSSLQASESCQAAVALPEATVTSKSLLLQQLEKPLMPPPVMPISKPPFQSRNNVLATQPPLVSETSVGVSKIFPSPSTSVATPTSSTTPIKYFCFKCKVGKFDSFSTLTDHQASCCSSSSLLPGSSLANSSTKISEVAKEHKKTIAAMIPLTGRKRYYKCSSCGTFHENWNLFLHVREKHNRHMCLYCSRFFPTAEKLALHLEIKHDLEQNHYHSEEALRNCATVLKGSYPLEARILMCCTCQHMFGEDESFSHHDCSEYVAPCPLCGQKGRHTNQCKTHSEAKHFSKLKKKKEKPQLAKKPQTKEIIVAPSEVLPMQPFTNYQTLTTETTSTESLASTLNCDIKPNSAPLALNDMHTDDSNSSSNMVIDESCTTSHPVTQTNPFKELDERVRLEEQQCRAMTEVELPPDRPEDVHSAVVAPPKLVVPKFKLRVPKEFQKSVDAALSTSESDDGEYGDNDIGHSENLADESKQNESNLTGTPSFSYNETVSQNSDITTPSTKNETCEVTVDHKLLNANNSLDEDDSLDEPNKNLLRIMQEIERTKLDIQRTKKVSRHATKPHVLSRSSATPSQSSQGGAEQNWSPTPPASPNSRWFPARADAVMQSQDQCNLDVNQQPSLLPPPTTSNDDDASTLKMLERRDTIGSDVMDIDETITGQPTPTVIRNELTQSTSESLSTSTDSNFTKTLDVNHSAESEMEEGKMSPNLQTDVFQKTENTNDSDERLQPPEKVDIKVSDEHLSPMDTFPHADLEHKDISEHSEATGEDEDKEIDVCGGSNKESDDFLSSAADRDKQLPADGIEVASEDTLTTELQLDRPIDKYETIEFVRICLKAVYPLCLYCNYARRIAVNGKSLVLHIIAHHRFVATVDSITAEELYSDTIVTKLKSFLSDLEEHHFNLTSYCSMGMSTFTLPFDERQFECFQCRFVTSTHKELYLHNRKMHLRTAILCFMCRAHFFSFSEILCHVCPGVANKVSVFDMKFRCCLCNVDNIPSPFRLMVHLRKRHFACDVCLEDCRDQSRLSSHVWKHKLHHLCYRCGIAYRNKMDITKHLFWKHGTESTICKRCLQKRWRHVYHFCIPPQTFLCEVCNMCFSKAMHLRVHKRLHTGDLRYPCAEDNCDEKFISRRLLLKHAAVHEPTPVTPLMNKPEESGKALGEEDEKPEKGFVQLREESIFVKKEPVEDANTKFENTLKKEENDDKSNIIAEKESQKEESKSHPLEQDTPRKRRNKKHKRPKELLDDLNLTAPNLSESDSSDDDSDSDSKTKSELDALPRVMLSPPSEAENEEEMSPETEKQNPGQVLEIWKNFLKTQQGTNAEELKRLTTTADYTEDNYPTPHMLHVIYSDHDYCAMYKPKTPPPALENKNKSPVRLLTPQDSAPKGSPPTKESEKSPLQLSSKKSENSSSSSGSSSSSDSSCSCGSNCSCSSSESDSSSSSSSSDDSDTSAASNISMRKKHRKKSERDRLRKKSESLSPVKNSSKLSTSDIVNVEDVAGQDGEKDANENFAPTSPAKEPPFCESDLETNESETDEEFYDEHPQKLANELLAQKRAQLMAQTRLSPSHNYDIVENSRPSTPSLPEEVAGSEKIKVKVKKKKRDRKTSCKAAGLHNNHANNMQSMSPQASTNPSGLQQHSLMSVAETQIPPPLTIAHPASNIYASATAIIDEQSSLSRPLNMATAIYGIGTGRISEGSSCSDADGSLKRSKRARRPNKFYGYTSDDENITSGSFGQPLMIGMRAFKPQPPPQLTWRKEDLPTPSKSILNNRNKATRTPKTSGIGNLFNSSSSNVTSLSSKKKPRLTGTSEKAIRKRPSKKKDLNPGSNLPPIPTLKIRPSEIGLNNNVKQSSSQGEYNMSESSSDDDSITTDAISTTLAHFIKPNHGLCGPLPLTNPASALLPSAPPPPPTPQTKAFNHKIPPALLPNPDFTTLQYFKANNIRYPIRPPAGARQPREGESVYCYCRCPYDEVSEMIACDGENCLIEWFHFECVGIMVAPQGKWFCAECRPKYSEELYPTTNPTLGNDINV